MVTCFCGCNYFTSLNWPASSWYGHNEIATCHAHQFRHQSTRALQKRFTTLFRSGTSAQLPSENRAFTVWIIGREPCIAEMDDTKERCYAFGLGDRNDVDTR